MSDLFPNESLEECKRLMEPFAERLHDGKGGFRDQQAREMRNGNPPWTGKPRNIVVDILAKTGMERECIEEIFDKVWAIKNGGMR